MVIQISYKQKLNLHSMEYCQWNFCHFFEFENVQNLAEINNQQVSI